jgi:hypothetical protein
MPADPLVFDHECVIHALGEVDLVGGWVEVALDPRQAARVGGDYQVLVTSYGGIAVFVQNRTAERFEIHAVAEPRARRRRAPRCAYCVLAWVPRATTTLNQKSACPLDGRLR